MVTYGIIPRDYTLAKEIEGVKILHSPTKYLIAGFMDKTPKERKELHKEYGVFLWEDLVDGVKKVTRSKKLLEAEFIEKGTSGGLVGFMVSDSRRPRNKKDPSNGMIPQKNLTMVKGVVSQYPYKLCDVMDVTSTSPDFIHSTGSDEAQCSYKIIDAHIALNMINHYQENKNGNNGNGKIHFCKPMAYKNPVLFFDFVERNQALMIEGIERFYVEGEKHYDISFDLLENHFDEITMPMIKEEVKRGDITFEVHKQKEKYPEGVGCILYGIGKNKLQNDEGFKRTGIVREIDGRCFWNYQKNRTSIRLMPVLEEHAMPIVRFSQLMPTPIEKTAVGWNYDTDPRTKKPRIWKDFDLNHSGNFKTVESLLSIA